MIAFGWSSIVCGKHLPGKPLEATFIAFSGPKHLFHIYVAQFKTGSHVVKIRCLGQIKEKACEHSRSHILLPYDHETCAEHLF